MYGGGGGSEMHGGWGGYGDSPETGFLPELVDFLSHEDEEIRNRTYSILADLGPNASSAVPNLVELLGSKDREKGPPRLIINCLATCGPAAKG